MRLETGTSSLGNVRAARVVSGRNCTSDPIRRLPVGWRYDRSSVSNEPVARTPGRLRSLYEWLTRTTVSPRESTDTRLRTDEAAPRPHRALRDRAQAGRGRHGRRVRRARRAAGTHGRAEDAVGRSQRMRVRASASGARLAPRRASAIRTSARSTRSARTAASSSSPWSCSRASRSPSGCGGAR